MSDKEQTEDREAEMLGELIRRAGPPQPVPELVTRRVRRNVEQAWRESRRRRRMPWLAVAAVVSAVAVTFAVLPGRNAGLAPAFGTVARVVGSPAIDGAAPLTGGDALDVGDRIVTGSDDALGIDVAGGASLRVDVSTAFVVEAPRRLRIDRGAVYIDSGGDLPAGAPFEIVTPFGSATDVGTQFLVRVTADHAQVLVREGRVDLVTDSESASFAAGRAAEVDATGAIAARDLAPGDRAWDWAEALATPFIIEGASLYDFLQWAARETGRELRFESDGARQRAQRIRLSGDIGDWRPDEAIGPVVATAGLSREVSVSAETILVR